MTPQAFTATRDHSQNLAASAVPKATHDEAMHLARTEFQRLLDVVESLGEDDWNKATYCTEWTVRQMVAHLAGQAATFASWNEFQRHYVRNPYRSKFEKPEDASNFLHVKDREHVAPADLVREFRETGPRSVEARAKLPWLVRALRLPVWPPKPVHYLTDTILTRDWWAHRLDLCHATGQDMVLTEEHDGRFVALVARELAGKVDRRIGTRAVDLHLTGGGGRTYRFGRGATSTAAVEMNILDFNLLASDRITPAEGKRRATVEGDRDLVEWFLANSTVLY